MMHLLTRITLLFAAGAPFSLMVHATEYDGANLEKRHLETRYGSYGFPGFSCQNILKQSLEILPNGIYFISVSEGDDVIPVYCDMLGGGWTMVFKSVTGFNYGQYSYWISHETHGEHSTAALDLTNSYKPTYKNRIVNKWSEMSIKEVRVSLYTGGNEDVYMIFKGEGTDNLSWFAKNNINETQWLDIKTEQQNFFSIEGDYQASNGGLKRSFYINREYNSCPGDTGWFVALVNGVCTYETRFSQNPFLYSKLNTFVTWSDYKNVGSSEVLAVFVR